MGDLAAAAADLKPITEKAKERAQIAAKLATDSATAAAETAAVLKHKAKMEIKKSIKKNRTKQKPRENLSNLKNKFEVVYRNDSTRKRLAKAARAKWNETKSNPFMKGSFFP